MAAKRKEKEKRQEKLRPRPKPKVDTSKPMPRIMYREDIRRLTQHKAEIVRDVALAVLENDPSRLDRWSGHEFELNEVLSEPVRFKLIPLREDVATMTIDRTDKRDALQDLATKFGGFVLEDSTLVLMSKRSADLATHCETRLGWIPEPVGRASNR